MEQLKRVTLIATFVGLFSGAWLGPIGGLPSAAPQAVAAVGVAGPAAVEMLALGVASAVSLDLASADLAAPTTADEDAPQVSQARRGGGIGLNLKK